MRHWDPAYAEPRYQLLSSTDEAEQFAREKIKNEVWVRRFVAIYDAVAIPNLGGIPHICTNDYAKKEGVSLWTDHGIRHTSRVMENVSNLLELMDEDLSAYELFLLFSASLIHDVGMFVRLVEGSLEEQRKYHGRLAQIALANYADAPPDRSQRDYLKGRDIWYIGLLAQLHQTSAFKQFWKTAKEHKGDGLNPTGEKPLRNRRELTYERLGQLGALILLADGIDVHRDRASNAGIFGAFEKVTGQVSPGSNAEWLVNRLSRGYQLGVTRDPATGSRALTVRYFIDPLEVLSEMEIGGLEKVKTQEKHETAADYFLSFLWRYIYDSHFVHVASLFGGSPKLPLLSLEVGSVGRSPSTVRRRRSTGREEGDASIYSSEWRFWYDGLTCLRMGEQLQTKFHGMLESLNGANGSDCTCFIIVKDLLRNLLRIWVPHNFDEIYEPYIQQIYECEKLEEMGRDKSEGAYARFARACLSARVPEKYSVAGQVWYRGLPEYVVWSGNSVGPNESTGRMMAKVVDTELGLHSLFYLPVLRIEDIQTEGRITIPDGWSWDVGAAVEAAGDSINTARAQLEFLLVFNRRKVHLSNWKGLLAHSFESWEAYRKGDPQPAFSGDLDKLQGKGGPGPLSQFCDELRDLFRHAQPDVGG